jgi:hypothetical protein
MNLREIVDQAQRDSEEIFGMSATHLGRRLSMKLNHQAVGSDPVRDIDLQEIAFKHGVVLPWLIDVLEEVQYLRTDHQSEYDRIVTELGETDLHARCDYLEAILDKLGATYDEETFSDEARGIETKRVKTSDPEDFRSRVKAQREGIEAARDIRDPTSSS